MNKNYLFNLRIIVNNLFRIYDLVIDLIYAYALYFFI